MQCLLCDNIIKATPKSKVSNYKKSNLPGCPDCTKKERYREYTDNSIKLLVNMGYGLLSDFRGKLKPITVINNNCGCGRSWTTKPERIFTGRSFCKPCNDDRKRKRLQDFNEDKFQQSIAGKSGYDRYQSEVRVLTERTYREHEKFINPSNLSRRLSGTADAYHLDHIISIKYCFDNSIPVDVCSHRDNLRIIPWKQNAIKWKRPTNYFPKMFWQYIDNYDEKRKIIKHINDSIASLLIYGDSTEFDYGLDLINHDKTVGVLIHRFDDIQEQTVGTKKYLLNMSNYFGDLGIRVIHVFEHEWLGKPELILRRLKHIVGDNDVTERIYARKCIIGDVSIGDKSKLLDDNHVQGNDNSTISLGAYSDGVLVANMTFTKSRVFMKGKIDTGAWELSRFATDTNYIVVGIASKLLKHFKENHEWDEIYSFADLRWSDKDNNVYDTLGFKCTKPASLSYHYVVEGEYKHRWNYQRKQLEKKYPKSFDKNLTEYQNMLKIGYDRIWDCGILKYVMQNE